jgi:hypothetical protein
VRIKFEKYLSKENSIIRPAVFKRLTLAVVVFLSQQILLEFTNVKLVQPGCEAHFVQHNATEVTIVNVMSLPK